MFGHCSAYFGAVNYLAGPGAAFVTGQTIVIDGGQYFH